MANNIQIKNIYYMLSYAYQSLNEAGLQSLAAEDFQNIHDLLAAIIVKGVSNQVKRGLNRDYANNEEVLGNLKGKIDITGSIKLQTQLYRRMLCQFDNFSEDTNLNRILKSTMMLLLRHGDVKSENKKMLRKLLLYFNGVKRIDPFEINWSSVRFHRNNSTYKMLINICLLVIKGLLLTTDDGQYKLSAYLDDQQMYRLYERFVLNYYKKEFPQYSASASYIDWDTYDDKQFLPVMKSDITLTNGDRTLIIDTKYYGRTMQTNDLYGSTSIISGNLYQIYTYVKNKDTQKSGKVSGAILYAKTNELITPDNDYVIGGNRISVKTLDLGADWSGIVEQLNALCDFVK
jgi:5-methylcytosine-specific restriction enzyme subunit McrC